MPGPAATRPAAVRTLKPPTKATTAPIADLHARPNPPAGWVLEDVPASERADKAVWFSPDKRTAYGVVYFTTFLPVNRQMALAGFLAEMEHREGGAKLLNKQLDDTADAMRFVAQMPTYTMYGKLMVDGRSGWIFFASTANDEPVVPNQLAAAERARDATVAIK
jgi:hypothetical protein